MKTTNTSPVVILPPQSPAGVGDRSVHFPLNLHFTGNQIQRTVDQINKIIPLSTVFVRGPKPFARALLIHIPADAKYDDIFAIGVLVGQSLYMS
jgi:hypothetical protein